MNALTAQPWCDDTRHMELLTQILRTRPIDDSSRTIGGFGACLVVPATRLDIGGLDPFIGDRLCRF
jgi:hypothetical protein